MSRRTAAEGRPIEGPVLQRTRLADLVGSVGDRLLYRYDFGDDWEPDIEVEAVHAAVPAPATRAARTDDVPLHRAAEAGPVTRTRRNSDRAGELASERQAAAQVPLPHPVARQMDHLPRVDVRSFAQRCCCVQESDGLADPPRSGQHGQQVGDRAGAHVAEDGTAKAEVMGRPVA